MANVITLHSKERAGLLSLDRLWPLVGPALALGALALYTRTLAPSVGGTMDSTEFQETAYTLSIAHTTGYPLYLLLARAWITLFPLGDPAFRVNFLSAVFAALAVWVLYALTAQIVGNRLPAVGGAALFAVSGIPWQQASVAEINSFNTLLTGLAFLAVIAWAAGRLPLPLAALAVGLALSHHRQFLLYLPLLVLYGLVALRRGGPRPASWRGWLAALVLLLLPFAAYVYLPLRAWTTPWYPNTWEGFTREVLGATAMPIIESTLSRPLWPRFSLVLFDQAFRGPAGWLLLSLAALGLLVLLYAGGRAWRERKQARPEAAARPVDGIEWPALLLCAGAFALGVVFAALYDIIDISDYLAVPIFMCSVLAGAGLAGIQAILSRVVRARPGAPARVWLVRAAMLGLLVVLCLGTARASLARRDIRVDFSNYDIRSRWEAIRAQDIPPNSILVADAADTNEVLYFQRVEGWRPDLSVVRVEDLLGAGLAPVDGWLQARRAVYTLGQYNEVRSRFQLRPVGPLWQIAGRLPPDSTPVMTHPLNRRFGDSLVLQGYSLTPDPPVLKPGDMLKVTMFWTATARVYERYTVFNHIVGAPGQMIGQQDDEPGYGYRPTAEWQPGDIITDTFSIPIHATAPPGTYHLIVGLYNSVTIVRLPAFTAGGQALGDYPELTAITNK